MQKLSQEELIEMKKTIKLEFRKSTHAIYIVKTHDQNDLTLQIGKELFPESDHYHIIGKL